MQLFWVLFWLFVIYALTPSGWLRKRHKQKITTDEFGNITSVRYEDEK